MSLARQWKQRETEDIFLCNRIATLVEMERNDFDLSSLKEVVLRHPDGRLGAVAAYTSACAHELRREYAKARLYAQMAMTRSEGVQTYLKGVSLNLLEASICPRATSRARSRCSGRRSTSTPSASRTRRGRPRSPKTTWVTSTSRATKCQWGFRSSSAP